MDTAPKDGTVVIIAGSDGKVYVAFHESMWSWKKFWVTKTWRGLWPATGEEYKFDVLGWQPWPTNNLPTKPSE